MCLLWSGTLDNRGFVQYLNSEKSDQTGAAFWLLWAIGGNCQRCYIREKAKPTYVTN